MSSAYINYNIYMNYQQFLFEEIHNQKQQPWRSWCYGLMVAMRESPHSLGLLSISSESDSMLVDAGITTMCWISSRWAIQIRLKTHTHDSSWHSKKIPHEETYLFSNIVHKFWFKNTFDLVCTNSSSSYAIYSIMVRVTFPRKVLPVRHSVGPTVCTAGNGIEM